MGVFVKAIVTGFGFSLGSAIFKRVSNKIGLEVDDTQSPPEPVDGDGDGDGEPDYE